MKQGKCGAANAVLFDNGGILPEALCQTKFDHSPRHKHKCAYFERIMFSLMHTKPVVFIKGKL